MGILHCQSAITQGERKKYALFLSPLSLLPPLTMLSKMTPLYLLGPRGPQLLLTVFPVKIRDMSWEYYPNFPRIGIDTP